MSKIVEKVNELIQPIFTDSQYHLVDIMFVKEGADYFLRIFVDKEQGIDLDDCALVSEKISEILDGNDPIEEPYFLEVSSPGAERPLKNEEDYHNAIGKYIQVNLYEKIDGDKIWQGDLLEITEETLSLSVLIKTRRKTITIPRNKIAKVRLAIKF